MKRIILLLTAVIMIFCTACSSSSNSGNAEPNSEIALQMEVISSFGITQKGNRIIAYKGENEYVEYIVAMYDGDRKTSEKTYRFYNSGYAYEEYKKENADSETITFFDDAHYGVKDSGIGISGTYDGDYMLIGESYDFR
jgi:hypothetical protein